MNIPFNNLSRYGLSTDKKPHEIMVEAWSRADNILFDEEGVHKLRGHTQQNGTPLHAPRWLFPWKSTTGFTWLYMGASRLGRINGTSHSDVTRYTTVLGDDDYATLATTRFSGALLGDLPVITYSGQTDPPQAYSTTNARFEDLPNWQANYFADIICEQDGHLVAMKVKTATAAYNPRMIKWSQAADPGTYPSSWDQTDPATGAGERTLTAGGEITATAVLGDVRLIYKEDVVYYMRFIGGQQIWQTDILFSQFGALGPYSVGELEKSHVVVSDGDVIAHNGLTWKSIIDKKNRKLLFDNLNASFKWLVTVKVKPLDSQVWICFPSQGSSGELDRALIWDYQNDTWSFRELQNFAFAEVGAVDLTGVSRVYDDPPQTTTVYDDATFPYDRGISPVFNDLVFVDFSNTLFYLEGDSNQFDGVNMYARLERTGLPIAGRDREGNWKIDLDSTKFLRRMHLNMQSSGPISIYLGNQEKPNGAVNWQGPFTFDPALQNFIDPYLNYRFLCIRIESQSDITWDLYGYTLEVEILGEASYDG